MSSIDYKELAKVRKFLCEHYDRKCYTKKCPMRKYYCYDFPSVESMFKQIGVNVRKNVIKLMYESAKEVGYTED